MKVRNVLIPLSRWHVHPTGGIFKNVKTKKKTRVTAVPRFCNKTQTLKWQYTYYRQ